jgi:hypothetical protein
MKVEIMFDEHSTAITFLKEDIKIIEELQKIASAFACSYGFEAVSLYENDFCNFIETLEEKTKYGIVVGNYPTGKPIVYWGKVTTLKSADYYLTT